MEEFYSNWLRINKKENAEIKNKEELLIGSDAAVFEPTNIVYETPDLKLIVEKGFHKKQKKFKLQDAMYYLKVIPTQSNELPELTEILDFLYAGFIHILDEIKSFYEPGNNMSKLTKIFIRRRDSQAQTQSG